MDGWMFYIAATNKETSVSPEQEVQKGAFCELITRLQISHIVNIVPLIETNSQ